ncbi:MAG: hypothetical protein WA962_10210 [Ornithinimicrobium sp.]
MNESAGTWASAAAILVAWAVLVAMAAAIARKQAVHGLVHSSFVVAVLWAA